MCKNILVASIGMSPAVITETLWALMNPHKQRDEVLRGHAPFVPELVHVVTTARGRQRIAASGLQARIRELYSAHGHPEPRLIIDVPKDQKGEEIEDINTEAENIAFADLITAIIRQYTQDPESAVHVSLAGGRKTMTSFTHAAITYFGRPQDRLSHVLVEPPVLETTLDFWWPGQPEEKVLSRDGHPYSTREGDAHVELVETPFVRLRHLLDTDNLPTPLSHRQVLAELQKAVDAQTVVLRFADRTLQVGPYAIVLDHREFALYATLATARKMRWRGVGRQDIYYGWMNMDMLTDPDGEAMRTFLEYYAEVYRTDAQAVRDFEKLVEDSRRDADAFKELRDGLSINKSKINEAISKVITDHQVRQSVKIHNKKKGNTWRFGLLLHPHQIELDRSL